MKYILSVLFSLALVSPAYAATTTPMTYGNGDPNAVTQSWGLTGHQSVVVKPGTLIVDEGGFKTQCATWETKGCVDISKTAAYRSDMIKIAKTLIATNQVARFPVFAGWVALAR